MSAGQQMPPWLQEQLAKMQQSQQNLQSIMTQKQQLEIENMETEKALDEIKKAGENDDVYKHAGSILIKSTKKDLIDDLEERKESNDRAKQTLELLGKIADNTLPEKETVKFEGIGQAGLGFVAALGGALTGSIFQQARFQDWIIEGLEEPIFSITASNYKLLGDVFSAFSGLEIFLTGIISRIIFSFFNIK